MSTNYPLLIIFYLEKDLMQQQEIIKPFVESVNFLIEQKNANVLAFFLPTDGEPRIECINPLIVAEADMEKINKMVEDIKENFSVGLDIDVSDEEIELDTPEAKPCECGKNADGKCKCD